MTSDLQDIPAPMQRQLAEIPAELTIADLKRRQDLVQQCLKEVMVPGHHFGVIPGTDKPTLLKPGIEKLCSLFRLSSTFQTIQRDLPNNHREYRVVCTLTHQGSGTVIATGDGLCSTMESKYRWRLASRKCPDCQSESIRKSKGDDGGFYCWSKIGGCGAKFPEGHKAIISQTLGRVENADIADTYNTVLKIGAKRAAAAACLIATACSDIFVEDGDEDDHGEAEPRQDRGGRKRSQAPPKLTRHQELCRDCAQAASALGASRDQVAELLVEAGITPPAKWGDLEEPVLVRAKAILEAKLKEGRSL